MAAERAAPATLTGGVSSPGRQTSNSNTTSNTANNTAHSDRPAAGANRPARYTDLLEAFCGLVTWLCATAALVVTAVASRTTNSFVTPDSALMFAFGAAIHGALLAFLWANRERFEDDQFGWLHPLHWLSVFWWAAFVKHLIRVAAPATLIEAVRMFEFKAFTTVVFTTIVGTAGYVTWTGNTTASWPNVIPYADRYLADLTEPSERVVRAPTIIWKTCDPGPLGPVRADDTTITERWAAARNAVADVDPTVFSVTIDVNHNTPHAEVRFDGGLSTLHLAYQGDWFPCGPVVTSGSTPN